MRWGEVFFSTLKWLFILVLLLIVVGIAYVWLNPTFGGKPDAVSLKRIQASPHFNGKIFVNLEPTELVTASERRTGMGDFLAGYFSPPAGKVPAAPL